MTPELTTQGVILHPVDLLTTTSLAVTPSPSPGQQEELDASTVTPGLLGFLVTFAVVLACIPLFRSMTTKLRGVERRAADEVAETDGGTGPGRASGPTEPVEGPPAARDGRGEPR